MSKRWLMYLGVGVVVSFLMTKLLAPLGATGLVIALLIVLVMGWWFASKWLFFSGGHKCVCLCM